MAFLSTNQLKGKLRSDILVLNSSKSGFHFKTFTKCKCCALCSANQMQVILALGQSGVSNFALIIKKIKKKCPLSQPISNQ